MGSAQFLLAHRCFTYHYVSVDHLPVVVQNSVPTVANQLSQLIYYKFFLFRVPASPLRFSTTMTTARIGCPSLKPSTGQARAGRSVKDSGVSGSNSSHTSWLNYRESVMVLVFHCKRYHHKKDKEISQQTYLNKLHFILNKYQMFTLKA